MTQLQCSQDTLAMKPSHGLEVLLQAAVAPPGSMVQSGSILGRVGTHKVASQQDQRRPSRLNIYLCESDTVTI